MSGGIKANALRAFGFAKRLAAESWRDFLCAEFGKTAHMAFAAPSWLAGMPHAMSIEPVNSCNLRCEFCTTPHASLKRKRSLMKLAEFRKVVDGLPCSVHYLWLFFAGEPLLNPELPEMVGYASSKNLNSIVNTNATLLTRETSRRLINAKLDRLIVSLDSITKENYEKMRRGGNFEEVMQNLAAFAEEKRAARSAKPKLVLQMIETKLNRHEVHEFKKFAASLDATATIKSFAIPSWGYTPREIADMKEKFLPKDYAANTSDKGCSFIRKGVVLVDGTVTPCCYDFHSKYRFGNALEVPFRDIWGSKEYGRAREMMRMRKLSICETCADSRD
ncbi:MAG: radical SAM protein [Candidatus Diapherotrites archaeon]